MFKSNKRSHNVREIVWLLRDSGGSDLGIGVIGHARCCKGIVFLVQSFMGDSAVTCGSINESHILLVLKATGSYLTLKEVPLE